MPNVTAKPVSITELIDNYARVIEQRDKLLEWQGSCVELLNAVLLRLDMEPKEAVFPCSAMREDIRAMIESVS